MAQPHVIHLITKLELGGAQRNTLLTVERLPRYGIHAGIWYGPGGILTPSALSLPHHRELPRLQRSIRPLRDRAALRQLRALLREYQPDIVHTHSSKAGFIGRRAAFQAGVPLVIHSVHGFPFSPQQAAGKKALFLAAERLAARWTSHFVFVSRADQDTAIRLGLCTDNSSLIRSGFDLEPYFPQPQQRAQVRKRFEIGEDAVVIGVVAPFKPQKNLFQVIDVAREVCARGINAIFFLAGDGDLRPRLEAAARRAGIESRMRMPGFRYDLPMIMDGFDLGLSTALWEGLPQSLVQMRLKRIPVVASAIPGNSEIIRHGQNGFLAPPHNTADYVSHILKLASEPELRRRLGNAVEDFSAWDAEHMVQAQAELYRRLLQKTPG